MFSDPFACSHQRAPEYFLESINTIKGFWGWACSSYINYLLGFCPPTNYQVLAGEHCKTDTRHGMYLINTDSQAPYAIGKWTDISQSSPILKFNQQKRRDPFQEMIDNWGKLDSGFNNNEIEDFDEDSNEEEFNKLDDMYNGSEKFLPGNRPNYDLLREMAKKKFSDEKKKPIINVRTNSKSASIEHSKFVEDYIKNLTKGIENPSVFGYPVRLDN